MRFSIKCHLNRDKRVVVFVAHAQIAFGSIVGKRYVCFLGEKQNCTFVFLKAFVQVVRIRFGYFSPLAIELGWDLGKFPGCTCKDVVVAFL